MGRQQIQSFLNKKELFLGDIELLHDEVYKKLLWKNYTQDSF